MKQSKSSQEMYPKSLKPESTSKELMFFYHNNHENKGLRNESKFNEYMDNLKKTRLQSSKTMTKTMETCNTLLFPSNKTHRLVNLMIY